LFIKSLLLCSLLARLARAVTFTASDASTRCEHSRQCETALSHKFNSTSWLARISSHKHVHVTNNGFSV